MRVLDVDGSVTGVSERDRARSWSEAELDREIATKVGALVAPGLARALALYETRGGFVGPRCRPCQGSHCYKVSEADAPFCARCRRETEQRALAKAAAE